MMTLNSLKIQNMFALFYIYEARPNTSTLNVVTERLRIRRGRILRTQVPVRMSNNRINV